MIISGKKLETSSSDRCCIEQLGPGRRVIDRTDELEITFIGSYQNAPEIAQAIDVLLEGSRLELGRAVPVFHRTVELEKGDVIGALPVARTRPSQKG